MDGRAPLLQPAGCLLGEGPGIWPRPGLPRGTHQPGLTWLLLCREWRCHSPVLAWSGAPVSPQRAPPLRMRFPRCGEDRCETPREALGCERERSRGFWEPGATCLCDWPPPPHPEPPCLPGPRALLVCSERGSRDPKNPIQRVGGRTCRPLFCELELVPHFPAPVCQAVSLRLSVRLCGCRNRTTPHPAGSRLGLCSCPQQDSSGFAPVL